jgi:hypothetical protein
MDIDLFLFGSAFTETWKLQRGMVIVILNPAIFKRKDGKGFNLRMNENKTPLGKNQKLSDTEGGESILEIGFSKDWGTCEALKVDGTVCGDSVDTRHTRVCEYHISKEIKRARRGRMEYAVGYVLLKRTVDFRMRPFSPKKETRNPFALKKVNGKDDDRPKVKKVKTYEPDRWDGGGGSVYHSAGTTGEVDTALSMKKRVEAVKRDLKGSERDRELRRQFKSFAPPKPVPKPPVEEVLPPVPELFESKAFDAKRLRNIGFDPRKRANEEIRPSDKKVIPIVGRISLDGVLGGSESMNNGEDMDGDSDSDLDIVMESDVLPEVVY